MKTKPFFKLFFGALMLIVLLGAAGCKAKQGLSNDEKTRMDYEYQKFKPELNK